MVIVALSLVVLMVFAALAIDMGSLYAARRSDQNAADAAAMAGLQEDTAAGILAEVDRVASATLEVSTGTIDWKACSTADPDYVDLVLTIGSNKYNCITQDNAGQALQVKLPARELSSTFGKVVGVNSFTHDAFAIGGVITAGFGGVLPFGLNSTGSSNLQCLKTGTSPHSEAPCDGPASGSFGYLDFSWFGNVEKQTPTTCTGATQGRLERNIAGGVDHDLGTNDSPETTKTDTDECTSTKLRAYKVPAQTGMTPQTLGNGAYAGAYADGPGRLARIDVDFTSGAGQTTISGYKFDNNALWDFMVPADTDGSGSVVVPSSCNKAMFDAVADSGDYTLVPDSIRSLISALPTRAEATRVLMDRCLTHYTGRSWTGFGAVSVGPDVDPSSCPGNPATPPVPCKDAVFARNSQNESPDLYDIQYTPRFGYVPQLTTAFPDNPENPNVYFIDTFRAIYLQRIVGGCPTHGGTCDLDFEPGLAPAGNSAGGKAEALTAWVFPSNILPNGLADAGAPYAVGKNRFLRLVR